MKSKEKYRFALSYKRSEVNQGEQRRTEGILKIKGACMSQQFERI